MVSFLRKGDNIISAIKGMYDYFCFHQGLSDGAVEGYCFWFWLRINCLIFKLFYFILGYVIN